MKLIINIILIFTSMQLYAQESKVYKNSLRLSVGLNQIKDKNLHSKVHRGTIYGLAYQRITEKSKFSILDIQAQFSKIKTKYELATESMNIQLKLRYAYLFEIRDEKLKFHFGPDIRANYRLLFFPNWDDSHLYWADDLSIGLSNQIKYRLSNTRSLVLEINMALLSCISRPNIDRAYKIDDVSPSGILQNMNSQFEFGSINKMISIDVGTEYQFQVSEKVKQSFFYHLNISQIKNNQSLSFHNIQHNIGLKIYF